MHYCCFLCRSNCGSVLSNHWICQSIRASIFLKHLDLLAKLWLPHRYVRSHLPLQPATPRKHVFASMTVCSFMSLQAVFYFLFWLFLTWLLETIAVCVFSSLGIYPASTLGCFPLCLPVSHAGFIVAIKNWEGKSRWVVEWYSCWLLLFPEQCL